MVDLTTDEIDNALNNFSSPYPGMDEPLSDEVIQQVNDEFDKLGDLG